jgi:ribosomal protein S12 methylthiotransferase accessory factor
MPELNDSRYTGLFRSIGATACRPHDPHVAVWAATAANRPWPAEDAAGGAGWTDAEARAACMGEVIERWQTHALPRDRLVRSSYAQWKLGEPAIDPERFVRFHRDQHALPGFSYERLDRDVEVDWVACRAWRTGEPIWAPADLVFLDRRPETPMPRFGPTISTGWAAHSSFASAVTAAIREVIERDAVVGAWWGSYPLLELDDRQVGATLGEAMTARIRRPNLRWRWYRVVTPFSEHVTLATIDGEDREGRLFAIGSACRSDRRASLEKSAIEAVQSWRYVRTLLVRQDAARVDVPTSFMEHAVFYTRHPRRLSETCLAHADHSQEDGRTDDPIHRMIARLPSLAIRHATPPALIDRGYAVARVVIPELQPLHGDHRFPFLGGPLWRRPIEAWPTIPPHPFA